ncbi:MAG: sigma-70 family RNA polymerase sigma factor [Clostridia bacterium]|nr:sigma-70 family RNA polymerase sigma factor [Clostridia bacterium]
MQLFGRKQPSFEALAAQAEEQVYKTCYHMMGNREDALDCAQEAMLRAYRAYSTFRREAEFSTWITRIALNVCADQLRKRREIVSLEALRETRGFDPPDGGATAQERLEARERSRLLQQALQQLPREARELIVLRDFRNLPYDQIAQITGLPLGTVKSRISRAREKLCDLLRQSSELFSSLSV